MKFVTVLIVCCGILPEIVFCYSENLLVKLPYGIVMGKDNGHYYSYEAIPYAEQPTGHLRLEPPQEYQQKWKSIFNATKPPIACMQWNALATDGIILMGSEDCLTISIYKRKSKKTKRSVLAFIHGGGFNFGYAEEYSHETLMQLSDMILVKINYRLGPLGFLSTEDNQIAGNFGLKDQRLALQWIKRNIASFGGDPNKIMLMGQSAGGASVHLQTLRSDFKNLVKVGVAMSGVAINPWVIKHKPLETAKKLAKLLNCPNTESTAAIKACMKSKTAQEIVEKVPRFLNFANNPVTPFAVVVESKTASNTFITKHPRDILKSRRYTQLPLLLSYTEEDGIFNAAELLSINRTTGKELLYELNNRWIEITTDNLFLNEMSSSPKSYALDLFKKYLNNAPVSVANYAHLEQMYTDVLFRIGIFETMDLYRKTSKMPVYGYIYDNPPARGVGQLLAQRTDIKFGTAHLDDLSLILPHIVRSEPLREDEKIVAHNLIKMLENFVEHSVPSYADCCMPNNARFSSGPFKFVRIMANKCSISDQTKIEVNSK